MRIRYSQEADALYIRLKENKIKDTDEVSEDLIIDYDADGNVVGIEILSASKKADTDQLIIQAFQKVMVENTKVAAA
ncbi:MAG: DUF2283 domain-containing protein [Candidatus Aminicenantes bacterium]|nr:DUF2283 domain-containing protein [Candidatus Aminicenantes bacterium]NIM81573.1 DUF2283 domain-containing protein [Candidatus Aminicenantes bacterium]NIN20944.1 DUF2283 domain-containing protein [Candidatus Aminicenantes bacterium]NIN44765.1 DUF2283 domain-containing protein [Candidatus Aminicenantes bacterium]NIN87573.1 DUF2283 domain-containing protein [Candidatus Aminicenantes bacterium]